MVCWVCLVRAVIPTEYQDRFATLKLSSWYVMQIDVDKNGIIEMYLGVDEPWMVQIMRTDMGVADPGSTYEFGVGIENRSGAAASFEIDYIFAEGTRVWD